MVVLILGYALIQLAKHIRGQGIFLRRYLVFFGARAMRREHAPRWSTSLAIFNFLPPVFLLRSYGPLSAQRKRKQTTTHGHQWILHPLHAR